MTAVCFLVVAILAGAICGRSIEYRSLTGRDGHSVLEPAPQNLIGNCLKTWYCQRCWMVAWRVAGLALQQFDSGLHFWRKSFILMAVTGRGTSTFAFQLWIV
jgi:hypothetical protein